MIKIYSNVKTIDMKALVEKTRADEQKVLEYPEFVLKHPDYLYENVLHEVEAALEKDVDMQVYTNSEIVINAVRLALLRREGAQARWICYTGDSVEVEPVIIPWRDVEGFDYFPDGILETEMRSLRTLTLLKVELSKKKK